MTLTTRTIALAAVLALTLAGCSTTSHDLGPNRTAAGATGGGVTASGVPTGNWYCRFVANNFNNVFTITSTLMITPEGTGHINTSFDAAFKGGYRFGVGKFAGRQRISWTTTSHYTKIAKVGNELYCYREARVRAQ